MSKEKTANQPASIVHGGRVLPAVIVESYNEDLKDRNGYVGDRASKKAFRDIVEEWREQLRTKGDDPFGNTPTSEIGKSTLDKYISSCDPVAAGLVHTAVEEFARQLADVTQRFLSLDAWRDTQHLVIGGGMSGNHIGCLAVGRTSILLAEANIDITLSTIDNAPDEAGLLGGVQLAPSWILEGHDAIVAVDIGGTNVRVGIVELKVKKGDIAKSAVWKLRLWRHSDDQPTRDEAMDRIASMINDLVETAQEARLRIAPFFAVGCPGTIAAAGIIERGAQSLPGDWESKDFNLASELARRLPRIHGHEPLFVIHNDAVVQGLSEVANMSDCKRWGIFTIGTGLGNARFTNRT